MRARPACTASAMSSVGPAGEFGRHLREERFECQPLPERRFRPLPFAEHGREEQQRHRGDDHHHEELDREVLRRFGRSRERSEVSGGGEGHAEGHRQERRADPHGPEAHRRPQRQRQGRVHQGLHAAGLGESDHDPGRREARDQDARLRTPVQRRRPPDPHGAMGHGEHEGRGHDENRERVAREAEDPRRPVANIRGPRRRHPDGDIREGAHERGEEGRQRDEHRDVAESCRNRAGTRRTGAPRRPRSAPARSW